MANTFTLIASSTVGSGGATNIEFTNIPGTYTDLCVKLTGRGTGATWYQSGKIEFNGSTTGYSYRTLIAVGGAPESGAGSGSWFPVVAATATADTFSNIEFYIPNYTASTNKSFSLDAVTENRVSTYPTAMGFTANLWTNTAAITSVKLTINSDTLVQYSTAYLYGIKKD